MIEYIPSDEIKTLAEQQRKDQRNERGVSILRSNKSGGSASNEIGPTSENLGGYTTGTSGNSEIDGGSNRGTKRSDKRGRSNYGRSIDNHLSSSEGNDQTTKPIGLEPIDVPITHKNTTKFEVPKLFAGKKKQPLTAGEIEALKDSLPACIQSYGDYIDKIIHHRSKVEEAQDIWGDLSLDESRMIARILIKRGAKSGHAADFVRQMVDGEDYVGVGLVIVPRIIKTVEELRLTPNAKRIRK